MRVNNAKPLGKCFPIAAFGTRSGLLIQIRPVDVSQQTMRQPVAINPQASLKTLHASCNFETEKWLHHLRMANIPLFCGPFSILARLLRGP
jgi:hypothetical protein